MRCPRATTAMSTGSGVVVCARSTVKLSMFQWRAPPAFKPLDNAQMNIQLIGRRPHVTLGFRSQSLHLMNTNGF